MTDRLRGEGASLPRVEEPDLFTVHIETITDPDLREQWHQLVETNPQLAEEILMRAFNQSVNLTEEERNPQTIAQIAVHVTTFALSAIGATLRRTDRAPLGPEHITRDVA